MDEKTLHTLEFFKILDRLAGYCEFSASAEKARLLRPTEDILEARRRQAETREALRLANHRPDLSIGEARDVRALVDLARHSGVLAPTELLEIKYTLIASRTLGRAFERLAEAYPHLADIAAQLPPPLGLVDAVSQAISDRAEIMDSASEKLYGIRRDLRVVHDRLMSKLQRLVGDPRNAPYLQEALVTQRDGRYVVPLRAEFKGRIKSIIHDQSASGATLFVEPLAVVEQNNQYRELQLAERDEERRILIDLSHQVGLHSDEINRTVEVMAELDLAFARGKYALELNASEPELFPIPDGERKTSDAQLQPVDQEPAKATGRRSPQTVGRHPGTLIRLYQARHPLLDPETVVPIDVELDPPDRSLSIYALVITGPNTGGKTVALKTVGLLALMAQAGLHIPAQSGSQISAFDNIFADIGDEQSIEQSLSTFSSHINNIIRILEHADPRSLVILDELGAGTDPQEGAALARALLAHLLERGITTLVTTHHPELKAFAHSTPGVVNASVEFNLETLRPTYHLTIGLPGRSNALAIAQRLGLPSEIITDARSELSPDDLRADDLLNEIHTQRDRARQARAAADLARQEAEAQRDELFNRLEKIEDERRSLLEQSRQEAAEQLQAFQEELAEARKVLARARQPAAPLEAVEEKVEELQETLEQPPVSSPFPGREVETGSSSLALSHSDATPHSYAEGRGAGGEGVRRPLRPGDKVRLRNLGAQGIISSISEDEAEVAVGGLRMRARLADLQLAKGSDPLSAAARQPSALSNPASTIHQPESPGLELDLRGKTSEEALDAFERYLDAAYLAGLPFVRIIHGKGTGKLREVVRRALHGHPHVRSFESGGEKEGGDGVTVVKLAN